MDRATLEDHLAMAEQHIAQGEQHIMRQRGIVAELERGGHDSTAARQFLVVLEQTQAVHLADRDRVQKELAAL
jgi:hypothetical protein